MKQFNDENFVLETQVAQDLFHNHAAKMPIIDYHCHLIPDVTEPYMKSTLCYIVREDSSLVKKPIQ